MLPWLQLILAIEPGILQLVKDFQSLLAKHPEMTADQLAAFLSSTAAGVHAVNADTLATVTADQAANPPAK
jgi:hypothetical protein